MKVKGISAQALAFIIFCGITAATGQGQDKLTPNIRGGFVTTHDGVKIHYVESKPKSPRRDSTLLFVPGLMTPGWIWEHQLAHFDQNYRVVATDLSHGCDTDPSYRESHVLNEVQIQTEAVRRLTRGRQGRFLAPQLQRPHHVFRLRDQFRVHHPHGSPPEPDPVQ